MVSRIAIISRRRAGLILGLAALLVPLLAVNGARVVDELPGDGGEPERGQAADDRARIAEVIGYDPLAFAVLALWADEPVAGATTAVALRTLTGQAEGVEGVARAVEGGRSADGTATRLSIHPEPGLGANGRSEALEQLREVLDPGIMSMQIGGREPTAEAARAVARGEAAELSLLVLPLIALILAGSLGVRMATATLLATAIAVGLAIFLLGIASGPATVHASAVPAAVLLGVLGAVEVSAGLLYRYREEAGTLGPGREAHEYAARVSGRVTTAGAVSAAAVGVVLLFMPIGGVSSIGAGLIAAAVSLPAAFLVALCATVLVGEREVGEPLPLVADRAESEGPAAFRWLLALRSPRRSAAAVLAAALIGAALAVPLIDSEVIGGSASELPGGEEARMAEERISEAFGPGALTPLVVAAEIPADRRGAGQFRDALAALPSVESVGRPLEETPMAVVEVRPTAPTDTSAGLRAAAEIREADVAPQMLVTGTGPLLLDGREMLGSWLVVILAIAALVTAVGWALWLRAPRAAVLTLAALPGPIAGVGALAFVFGGGHLSGLLAYEPAGGPHLLSLAAVAATLLAIGLGRGAALLAALREELALEGGIVGSIARAGTLALLAGAVATAVTIVAAAAWLGSDLLVAKELAVGIAAGLVADLLLGQALLAPALARLTLPGRIASRRR